MSFKIVKIIQNGKFCLWTVPEAWESDYLLRYPPSHLHTLTTERLRRDPYSRPDDTWVSANCMLIRSNLNSFQAAELEIRRINAVQTNELMRNEAKTDAFEDYIVIPLEGSKTRPTIQNTMSETFETNNRSEMSNSQYSALNSKIDTIRVMVSEIAKSQTALSENQEILMNKLSEICCKFDDIKGSNRLEKSKQRVETMKPIADKQSLEDFSKSLQNEHNAQAIKDSFSVLFGHGKGRAINNAYVLLDAMFDRKFLVECSWAGGSRGNTAKICFKSYESVIDLFFQIIYASDKQFTKMACEDFLKSVLRNAKKRCGAKMMRASRMKRKSKRNRFLDQEDEEDDEETPAQEEESRESINCDKQSAEDTLDHIKMELEPTIESEEDESDYLC